MVKAVISGLVIFFCTVCNAQNDSIRVAGKSKLKLSYNSSLIYPGVSAGAEFPFSRINNKLIKNQKSSSYIRERYVSFDLNWYHHPGFHDNVYLTSEWVMRRTRYKGFISEFSLGPGFSRTFLGGTTYRVNENGDISIVKQAGYNYALITLGGGFGYDFSMVKKKSFSCVAKMNIITMFPYNSTLYFRPVLEIGIRYSPRSDKLIY